MKRVKAPEEERPALSVRDKILLGGLTLFWLTALFIFTYMGWNIFQPKKIIEQFRPDRPIGEFKKRGLLGRQRFYATIQKVAYEGDHVVIVPFPGCEDVMIVDIRFRLSETDIHHLSRELLEANGVARNGVKFYQSKIAIHRSCVAARGEAELWTWEEVWGEIEPILRRHFK